MKAAILDPVQIEADDPKGAPEPTRRLLFISHANPEDNAAASWFATQLTLMGYEVWCDLKNTHGGESDFWLKVQKKIENDAAKFIFILSDASRDFERKKGIYKEVQAADNTRQDNFIIPLRTTKLTGSVPIIIGPDIYINSENWADGLRELHRRLIEDNVPRTQNIDYQRISSWWPAISVEQALVRDESQDIVSNVLPFEALPENIHLLKVSREDNPLTGYERLKKALPNHPAHYPHGNHTVSFACAHDFLELTHGYAIEDDCVLPTQKFLNEGYEPAGIIPQIAKNIGTFLIASSLEHHLGQKGLHKKELKRSRRKIWFPPDKLIPKNKMIVTEPGRRKSHVSLIGSLKYYRKRYIWHFGVQPSVDLHTHFGILFSPKAILSPPYKIDNDETPTPVDEKKALKKLGWWNKQWRQKLLAFTAWLSDSQEVIRVPAGYQEIALSAHPLVLTGALSYLEKDEDALMKEIMEWRDA